MTLGKTFIVLTVVATWLSASAAMGQTNSLFHRNPRNPRNPAANPPGAVIQPDDGSAGQAAPSAGTFAPGATQGQANGTAPAGSAGSATGTGTAPAPQVQPGQSPQQGSAADETNRPVVLSAGPVTSGGSSTATPVTPAPVATIPLNGQPPAGQAQPATVGPAQPQATAPVQADSLAMPTSPGLRTDPSSPDANPANSFDDSTGKSGHDRSMSPAMASLSRVSFLATAAPEVRKFRVHDLLTIVVNETSTFSTDGSTKLEKTNNLDVLLTSWFKMNRGSIVVPVAAPSTPPELKVDADRKFEGDGTVKRTDSFIGRLTAEIVDVKPNGTLVVTASKFIKTDEEEQTFELTGTCRTADITADNSVLSTQLGDLTVRKTHKGAVEDTTKRGVVPWLTDKANPW